MITILSFLYANIVETKGLVPLIISEVSQYKVDLNISITFVGYGDQCINSNRECSESISIVSSNIIIGNDYRDISCVITEDAYCRMRFVCKNCEIDTGAKLSVVLSEILSYSTEIIVNVTTSSSIPNENSGIRRHLSAESGKLFRGSVASEFYFTMIPSIFLSEIDDWDQNTTGYHVSVEKAPLPGSMVSNFELISNSDLKLNINLDRSNSILVTQRSLFQT